jgi:Ca2+:H+ antiporter
VLNRWSISAIVLVAAAAAASRFAGASLLTFVLSAAAIVPLAREMGAATHFLVKSARPGVSGLLNATFGNAAELIIAIVAIRAGEIGLVKASISGSVIGNLLLVLGLAMVLGGARRVEQKFPAAAASTHSTMLALAVIGLVVPAAFFTIAHVSAASVERLSVSVAIVLMAVYLAGLVFTFVTHKEMFAAIEPPEPTEGPQVPLWQAVALLALAAAAVAWMSELLVASIGSAVAGLGLTTLFIGVVVVPVIGNAAEHYSAVTLAMRDRMDVALDIAVGSSTQVALFVAPLLVLVSLAMGRPMSYLFTRQEIVAIVASVTIAVFIARDAKSNWLEGVQLLAVYLVIALAFFFLPA